MRSQRLTESGGLVGMHDVGDGVARSHKSLQFGLVEAVERVARGNIESGMSNAGRRRTNRLRTSSLDYGARSQHRPKL